MPDQALANQTSLGETGRKNKEPMSNQFDGEFRTSLICLYYLRGHTRILEILCLL